MSDFQQMAGRLAPVLVTVTEAPYWVSIIRPATGPGRPPVEALVEFWLGPSFDDWFPPEDCIAILGVVPGRASGEPLPPLLRGGAQAGGGGCLVYGVSREGEVYAGIAAATGQPMVELEVRAGRLLDALRSKFGLPPGPPSVYDLQMSSKEDERPIEEGSAAN